MTEEKYKKAKMLLDSIEHVEKQLSESSEAKRYIDEGLFKTDYSPHIQMRVYGLTGIGEMDFEFQLPKKIHKEIVNKVNKAISETLMSLKEEFAKL